MGKPSSKPIDRRYNRDEEQKTPSREGKPPRPASEPEGSEGSTRNDKTATDPATGEPNR
jgi:hypothetical protein